MRLIDGDALTAILESDDSLKHARELIRLYVEEAPTIPAEVVVHCGECEKWHTSNCRAGHEQASDDYCSHDIRKGGGE